MKIKLSKKQWEDMGKKAGWIQDEVQKKSRISREIANILMHNHGITNFELRQQYPFLSPNQADRITRYLVANAFGPEGKGFQWLGSEILKLLVE